MQNLCCAFHVAYVATHFVVECQLNFSQFYGFKTNGFRHLHWRHRQCGPYDASINVETRLCLRNEFDVETVEKIQCMSSRRVCRIAIHLPDNKSLHCLEGTGDEVAMRAHNRISPDESAK
jgi:hypothetical protein